MHRIVLLTNNKLTIEAHHHLCVAVEHGKVGDYDWNGEGDHKDAREGAQGAHDDSRVCLGYHITIPNRGHCHHCPPQPLRYTFEIIFRVCMKPLCIVDKTCEYHHSEYKEEYQ